MSIFNELIAERAKGMEQGVLYCISMYLEKFGPHPWVHAAWKAVGFNIQDIPEGETVLSKYKDYLENGE